MKWPVLFLWLGVAWAQLPMPFLAEPQMYRFDDGEFLEFSRGLSRLLIFGPGAPLPLAREHWRDRQVEVIAGELRPPSWVAQARSFGASVTVYLLPGDIAPGSFMVADERFVINRERGGWQVLDSPETAMVVLSYMGLAIAAARQSGRIE